MQGSVRAVAPRVCRGAADRARARRDRVAAAVSCASFWRHRRGVDYLHGVTPTVRVNAGTCRAHAAASRGAQPSALRAGVGSGGGTEGVAAGSR